MTATHLDQRLSELGQRGKTVLVVYLTVGDPSVDDTLACARAALDAGADVLELGVPFSDPTADGPVIAAASHRAIAGGGSLRAALGLAKRLKADSDAPLVLFSYYNPIVAFGEEDLPRAAVEAGVDALLAVDLPPEEGDGLRRQAQACDLAIVPLVTPTTGTEREARVLAGARGFVYYVSVTGVTGGRTLEALERAGRAAAALRQRAKLPVAVGFGIDSPEKARAVAKQGVDAVVVGPAVVRAIAAEADRAARVEAVRKLVGALRAGLDAPSAQP